MISPVQLTNYLADGSHIITGQSLKAIKRLSDGWQIDFLGDIRHTVSHLVLAVGSDLPGLLQKLDCPALPLQVTSGQLSYFPQDNQMQGLQTALHYGGYIAADRDGHFIAGASFDKSASLDITADAHDHNIGLMPDALRDHVKNLGLSGRVSKRLATSDRWPLLGAYGANLSIISALGARGLTLAPLLGEVLARQITGRPLGLDREIMAMIEPTRFQKRMDKRLENQSKKTKIAR